MLSKIKANGDSPINSKQTKLEIVNGYIGRAW